MSQSSLLAFRQQLLERDIPKWLWPYTCRCRAFIGMWFDSDRLMWCCDNCNLPTIHDAQQINKFISDCLSCGNSFMIWSNNVDSTFCKECGGTNEANKGARNTPETDEDFYA